MDVILTPNGGSAVHLCMLPEIIKYGGSGKFMTYSIIALGDVKVPRGSALEEVSWNGIFPGKRRRNEPYVLREYWKSPARYIKQIRDWRDEGTKVNVTITETGVNIDCYVQKFDGKFTGGYGDFEYDISFVEAQEITITTAKKTKKKRKEPKKKKKGSPKNKPKTRLYTVKKGDCLWRIAQKMLGKGSRYTEIYELNKSKLEKSKHLYAGMVLTIPAE